MPVSLDRRLARLETMRDDAPVTGGVSGILAACARLRAQRLASGVSDEEHEAAMERLPKPPWVISMRAAMARHRQGARP